MILLPTKALCNIKFALPGIPAVIAIPFYSNLHKK